MDTESLDFMDTLWLETAQENSSLLHQLMEVECILCRRTYIPLPEEDDGLDSIPICLDCNSFVIDNTENASPPTSSSRRRSRRSRYGSSESLETAFSQHFSHLLGHLQHDDTAVAAHRPSRYGNRSRRVRRTRSDTDNDGTGNIDSLFGESDSHFNFGGDSEASFDARSVLEMEPFSPLDNGSRTVTDTDIDPMHAGLDHWASDDQDDYGEREEVNTRHSSNQPVDAYSPIGSTSSPLNGASMQWSAAHLDLFTDEAVASYIYSQEFEEFLEQLVDADSSTRDASPAPAACISNLPCVVVSMEHERNGSLFCAVCREPLSVNTEASQLPCSHLYHPSCILPWLRTRSSCPVCRFELVGVECEEGRRNGRRNEVDENRMQEVGDEVSEMEGEGSENSPQGGDETDLGGGVAGDGGGGGWRILMSAAPILSIIGVAIAMWFRSSVDEERIRHGSFGRKNGENKGRRWWFPF